MISEITIKDFKSIVDLRLELGRVNLFIGENGSGKSNILEAVAFATSTAGNRVNLSVLSAKGVRINKPELYASAFDGGFDGLKTISISLTAVIDEIKTKFNLDREDWIDMSPMDALLEALSQKAHEIDVDKLQLFVQENWFEYLNRFQSNSLSDYMLYSPEVSSLRKFDEEGQVKPLGAHGQGLFSLLKEMAEKGEIEQLKENLEVINWFEDFFIPKDLMSNEYKINIKDRFINSDLQYLDQRSANEGFLFLLFYIALFSSKKTPKFFAIDNIEASFNPKLCAKLVEMIVSMSQQNDKQVLMTTHNPATLDGLDLNDPEQRLFVVRRNIDGHTIVTRITEKPKLSAPMKLSEMWTKGLLGGLPDNF